MDRRMNVRQSRVCSDTCSSLHCSRNPHRVPCRLAEGRKHLIASLNAFTAGPSDGGDLDTAVNASEQLQHNMAEEVTTPRRSLITTHTVLVVEIACCMTPAVDLTRDALICAQNSLTHEFQYWFLCNVLTPVQEARLELISMCV